MRAREPRNLPIISKERLYVLFDLRWGYRQESERQQAEGTISHDNETLSLLPTGFNRFKQAGVELMRQSHIEGWNFIERRSIGLQRLAQLEDRLRYCTSIDRKSRERGMSLLRECPGEPRALTEVERYECFVVLQDGPNGIARGRRRLYQVCVITEF